MKTTHELAAELLALPNVPVVVEGWMLSREHEMVAVITAYDPETVIIMQREILTQKLLDEVAAELESVTDFQSEPGLRSET